MDSRKGTGGTVEYLLMHRYSNGSISHEYTSIAAVSK